MFDREGRWYKRVIIVDIYHCSQLLKDKKWKVVQTADYFNISVGHASEAITLAEGIRHDSELEKLSRNRALKTLRQ